MNRYTLTTLALASVLVMTVTAYSGACKDRNGNEYGNGEKFRHPDGCNHCFCTNGYIKCTRMACTGCLHKGTRYSVNEKFMDQCNKCRCTPSGVAACTRKHCPVCRANGFEYKVGESYTADDGCNTCTCTENGFGACTLMAC